MTDRQISQINNLIFQIALGDVYALDDLSAMVSGRMLAVALSVVRNRTLAEDVVQESFLKIVNNAGKFKRDTNGYAWICKIVQNVALNTLRHEKRFAAADIDEFFDITDGTDLAQQSTSAVAVAQAMSVLNGLERLLIYQKYFMDFTVRDSAKATGKSKSAVQRIIRAAEEKMKNQLTNGTKPHNEGL